MDAAKEEKHGRLRWLASDDGVTPSAADARPPPDPEEELEQQQGQEPRQLPRPKKPPPQGHVAVGCTIGVWWIDDAQYYFGKVMEYDQETSERLAPPHKGSRAQCGVLCFLLCVVDQQCAVGCWRGYRV